MKLALSITNIGLAAGVLSACAVSAQQTAPILPEAQETAIYSNMEEVYFDAEAGKKAAPWTSIRLSNASKEITFLNAYGDKVGAPDDWGIVENSAERLVVKLGERRTEMRRANNVTCWGAVRKFEDKADGSADWTFEKGLNLHDQGGRVTLGGDGDAPETILRIRRVTWAAGSNNQPSLVLYVHKPEAPDKAVSYSWADTGASRIGINLRWMQASCSIALR